MKRIALILALIGIFVLFVFLQVDKEILVSGADLESYEINQRVLYSGEIESVRDYGSLRIFESSGFSFVCECSVLEGQKIYVEGKVEEYEGKRQIRVLEISVFG